MGEVAALALPMTRIGRSGGPPIFRPNSSGLPAKRRLFGRVDHAQINQTLQRQEQKIREENTIRWNFDFVAEKPLEPGRYVWEKVDQKGRCPDDGGRDGRSNEGDDAGEGSERRNQRQTQITEFMRKRKLSTSEKTDDTSLSKIRRRSST